MSVKIDLNIQPTASSIYSIFTRLNYTEWYALAEFVDNSTASFIANERKLAAAHIDKLNVEISYDKTTDTITIEDNAFGMELEDFKRAILVDAKPTTQGTRNEFGMGLKTAATWFGRHWQVESSEYESTNKYSAYIDLDELNETKANHIDIDKSDTGYYDHFTKLTITKLNRHLNTIKIKNKIIDVLRSMYRRDLKKGKIEITFNGTTLSFQDIDPLVFKGETLKKDVSFSFEYEGKGYSASGFVGIMSKGSFPVAGFALFRRDRVVVGGYEQNYKPKEIFIQDQNPASLKLYGEIDMDDFEINQAKDNLSWSSELEELFVSNLKTAISDYLPIAKMTNKEIKELQDEWENSKNPSVGGPETVTPITPIFPSNPPKGADEPYKGEPKVNPVVTTPGIPSVPSNPIATSQPSQPIFNKEGFIIKHNNVEYIIAVKPITGNYFLYEFSDVEKKLVLNTNHSFNGGLDKSMYKSTAKIILAFVLAMDISKKNVNSEGFVSGSTIRNLLSRILQNEKD